VITLVLIAQLCTGAVALQPGDVADCTGILWPIDKTKAVIACHKVDLPDCERRLTLVRDTLTAKLEGCQASLGACKGAADPLAPVEPETPVWGYLTAGGGGLLVGALAGVLLVVVALD
jgi:hypothetical protein